MSDSVRPHRWQPTRLPRPWDSPGKNTGVGCHFLLQCMKVKSEREVAQSCLTLRDPMDCSPPGSSIHAIFQARVLEWGAIAFSALYNRFLVYPLHQNWLKCVPFYGWLIFHCVYVPQLLYPSVSGNLGCFHVLATVNSAAVNNGIHVSFSILVSSEYMPRSRITGSYGGFIPSFF